MTTSRAALVGRDAALRQMAATLETDAQAVLVVGEAGMGKTSLVAEHIRRANRMVLLGHCVPLANASSILPFTTAFACETRGSEPR
jgi:predicted ATPase